MHGMQGFCVKEKLKDGRPVSIRAVRPDDKERFKRAFQELERETVYRRFFQPKAALSESDLKAATEVDFQKVVALVATIDGKDGEVIIGSGRYAILDSRPGTPCRAEVSFTVEEDYQGQGIATSLLRHLAEIGRKQGVEFLVAEVMRNNRPMLAVFEHSGLPLEKSTDVEGIQVVLRLRETQARPGRQ